jgi:hypothetical protein
MELKKKRKRKMIGWREWVELPELGIEAIKVKVDSGARTSALHATKIRYIEQSDGNTVVSFMVTKQMNPRKTVRVHAPLVEQRVVKSSLGHASLRPVIRTIVKIGKMSWPVEITLINRDPMGFRMLLGRQAVRSKFLIHPARSYIQSSPREEL